MSQKKSVLLVFAFLLCFVSGILGGWALSGVFPAHAEQQDDSSASESVSFSTHTIQVPEEIDLEGIDMEVFWEVWELVYKQYLHDDQIDPQLLMNGAIEGMVNSLGDPYSYYTQSDYVELNELEENYEGIGAQLQMNDRDEIVIMSPFKGSPAEAAGLQPGDIIVSVDGEDVYGKSLDAVVTTIRGEGGTDVVLSIYRPESELEENPFDVTITRGVIETPSLEVSFEDYNGETFAVVQINQFTEETGDKFQDAIDEILAQNVSGMILDLRFNPGGYISPIPDLLAPFFKPGELDNPIAFTLEGRTEDDSYTGSFKPTGELADLPMVILVNEGTASASEILTGALQDYQRATVIGTQTFGKGITQMLFDLSDGSRVQLTDTEWYTPNHRNIHKIGLTPDIVIEMETTDAYTDLDIQMDKALEVLSGQ